MIHGNERLSLPALPEQRDGFRFRGGHVALDLAATLAARLKPAPRELLATPGDLDRWFAAAGLGAPTGKATDADLSGARAVREAIYAIAMATIAGTTAPTAAIDSLNRAALGAAAVPQIGEAGRIRLDGPPDGLIALLAREAILLLGDEMRARVRQCESDSCALLFLDTSRGGDRRWCSMTGCGNKAKVAEFRRRKRAAAGA
jgi:predicted RNA-binding Zn ribbon-like protein